MQEVKIIKDQFDRSMVHVYVKDDRYSNKEARWYLTSSMHADMAEALFTRDALNGVEENGEIEIIVTVYLIE